ncbi:ATP-binding response regulator [Brevibacillus reuszeri]|uniref:ATP-binding response regulator n=1 Tax=Brevibacillus reuszeri TaxID=54915 RepID=UPI0028A1A400|nr:ATP-binding protein [Brevibacillus reuszeri]
MWSASFSYANDTKAISGVLDLRDWNAETQSIVLLNGEWDFYPQQWLIGEQRNQPSHEEKPVSILVPGSWNQSLQPGNDTPYGFGSYRLKILVDPAKEQNYSLRFTSIRSASTVYVDGVMLGKSGQTGENGLPYVAENRPYTATFSSIGKRVIELVVQVENHMDSRGNGIAQPIKIGTKEAIEKDRWLSLTMQQLVTIIFFVLAVYALILYVVGNKDKRLLSFALLAISILVAILVGSEEKLWQELFFFPYVWRFRLTYLALIGISYGLMGCVREPIKRTWPKWYPTLKIVCLVSAVLALLLPGTLIMILLPFFVAMMDSLILISIVSIIRVFLKEWKENIFIMLSLIALANQMIWWTFTFATEVEMPYYPFDLIVSVICFSSFWLKQYFKVYADMEKLTDQLQRADRQKDEFLANTSHELRNPLHSILNMTQSILERESMVLTEDSRKNLDTVLSVGRRMSLMLRDLLDVKKLQESPPRLELQNVSLHPIAKGVMDMLHFMTAGKSLRLINEIPEHFPHVLADENRVTQILFNLLHNAVKYTNEGKIVVRSEIRDKYAHIFVTDTGIGMDEETMQRALEPYVQGEYGKTMAEGGFGLGLSICKQLVELHGGELYFRSVPTQGSEFVFTLPIFDMAATNSNGLPAERTARMESVEALVAVTSTLYAMQLEKPVQQLVGRPRILIVDDEPVNLKVLETILTGEQYEMTSVVSGKQALSMLDTKEWDLVITDVMMPQMSGYELTRRIRERFTLTELPVLLLTARSHPQDIENGFLSGANDYVTKPVEALEIRSRVRALTEVKKSAQERLQMEAAWLQAQIQPHFLFNTLSAIAALSEINLERMRTLLEAFNNFLQSKFKLHDHNQLFSIEDELDLVRSYLFIEQERFEERLHVEWEIEGSTDVKIPMLTIQPLVENAVNHGLMKRVDGGTIRIRIENKESHVEVYIEDDGIGMEEVKLKTLLEKTSGNSGVGLRNTDQRLKRCYGHGLRIQSKLGQGTIVSFRVDK